MNISIIGAGITGLTLADILIDQGFTVKIFEKSSLGHGQTIASQGILHGGLKYQLLGKENEISQHLKSAQNYWNDLINKTSSKIKLSDSHIFLGKNNLASKMQIKFLEKNLKTLQKKTQNHLNLQNIINHNNFIDVPENILNIKYLLEIYQKKLQNIFYVYENFHEIYKNSDLTFLCAGNGNKQILDELEIKNINIQKRPLKMNILKGNNLPSVFFHLIGFSKKPLMTVTTHSNLNSKYWYLGGNVAENTDLTDEKLCNNLKKILKNNFKLKGNFSFTSHYIERTEINTKNRLPSTFNIEKIFDDLFILFPTKLTLAPTLGLETLKIVSNFKNKNKNSQFSCFRSTENIKISHYPWEDSKKWIDFVL